MRYGWHVRSEPARRASGGRHGRRIAAAPPLLAEARAQRRSRLGGWRLLKGARKAGSCRAAGPSARPCDQQAGRGSCGCGAGPGGAKRKRKLGCVCRGRVFVFTGIKTHIAASKAQGQTQAPTPLPSECQGHWVRLERPPASPESRGEAPSFYLPEIKPSNHVYSVTVGLPKKPFHAAGAP